MQIFYWAHWSILFTSHSIDISWYYNLGTYKYVLEAKSYFPTLLSESDYNQGGGYV
jgi:hypothetical protein